MDLHIRLFRVHILEQAMDEVREASTRHTFYNPRNEDDAPRNHQAAWLPGRRWYTLTIGYILARGCSLPRGNMVSYNWKDSLTGLQRLNTKVQGLSQPHQNGRAGNI